MNFVIAYLTVMAISVDVAMLLACTLKYLNKNIAVLSLAAGLTIGIYVLLKPKLLPKLEKKDFDFWSIAAILTFILISLRAFLWLIFQSGDTIRVLSPNNLGDISLHINYINYFTSGVKFWPDNSIFFGDKIRYPIGVDLFNSLLLLSGVDLIKGLIWVGLLSAFATCFALFLWGRAFTVAGFLFNGGLAGLIFFKTFHFTDFQAELAWKNIVLSMFVTQRGLLYAFPVGLLLLYSFRQRYFNNEENLKPPLPLWLEILLYTSMPIFHFHTFIYFTLLLGIWILVLPLKQKLSILKLVLPSIPLATFFVFLLTDNLRASSQIHIKWGWMQGNENFFKFWLFNFGIFWPLVIFLCYKLIKDSTAKDFFNKPSNIFVFPAVILFVVFTNVMMAGWEWDNAKLLVWSYIILLPFLWEKLISKWQSFEQNITCFMLFVSGFVCVFGGFPSNQGYEVFRFSEVTEVKKAIKAIPAEHRFAAFPTYNHPVLLNGRKVVLGYPGWLWSNGYKVEGKDEKLKRLMMGDSEWRNLARELGVNYIFWGHREMQEYRDSTKPWEKEALKITEGEWGAIYGI